MRTKQSEDQLVELVPEFDALVVRSETRVTARVLDAGKRLRVVGRAGVGVDNIDVPAATAKGILVVNAPRGNIIAAAEHTIGLLFALARNIPQADASVKRGEWTRSKFTGVEVRGKVLGLVGLGNIGSEVAKRAQGLEMEVVAYDPAVPPDRAEQFNVRLVALDELLRSADFISIHAPLVESTRNLIDARRLAQVKPSARLLNAARGGIVDEAALYDALAAGRLAGAACDVFLKEPLSPESPLLSLPNFIATPHVAASTAEAQTSVAFDVVSERVSALEIECAGELAEHDTSLVTAWAVRGIVQPFVEDRVNAVNARLVAAGRGLRLVERRIPRAAGYPSSLALRIDGDEIEGTVLFGEPRVTRIGAFRVDLVPEGRFLVSRHEDRPGVVGRIGTILGENDINIASMQVGRDAPRGRAMMILAVDDVVDQRVLGLLRGVFGMSDLRYLELGSPSDG